MSSEGFIVCECGRYGDYIYPGVRCVCGRIVKNADEQDRIYAERFGEDGQLSGWRNRALAAEAEVERLREALERLEGLTAHPEWLNNLELSEPVIEDVIAKVTALNGIARAALADEKEKR